MPDALGGGEVKARLAAAARAQHVEAWIPELSALLSVPLTKAACLTPNEEEQLRAAVASILSSRQHITELWSGATSSIAFAILNSLLPRAAGQTAILLPIGSPAVKVPAASVLENASKLLEVVGPDLYLVMDDLASGLSLEHDYYDGDSTYVPGGLYKLASWGHFA